MRRRSAPSWAGRRRTTSRRGWPRPCAGTSITATGARGCSPGATGGSAWGSRIRPPGSAAMGDRARDLDRLPHLAHPWHGVSPGDDAPDVLTVYIEMVPTDTVKYEVDKASGLLRADRPQKYSALCPTLYGF